MGLKIPFSVFAVAAAFSISLACLLLGTILQRAQRKDGRLPAVPPLVSCGLVGLLLGLSLLVLLPSALDGLIDQGYTSHRVLLTFSCGPILMHVLNNIVLNHNCCAEHPGADAELPPALPPYREPPISKGEALDEDLELDIGACEPVDNDEGSVSGGVEEDEAPARRVDEEEEPAWLSSAASDVGMPSPVDSRPDLSAEVDPEAAGRRTADGMVSIASRRRGTSRQPQWLSKCSFGDLTCKGGRCAHLGGGRFNNPARSPTPMPEGAAEALSGAVDVGSTLGSTVVRLTPWFVHALLDGWMLGTSQTLSLLLALSLPVAICACQDTASLVLGETVRAAASASASRSAMRAVAIFASAFPIGTALALWLSPAGGQNSRLLLLRALTAGAFLYMALVDFAPKERPHGRRQATLWLIAFLVGLGAACLAEAFEDLMSGSMPMVSVGGSGSGGGGGGGGDLGRHVQLMNATAAVQPTAQSAAAAAVAVASAPALGALGASEIQSGWRRIVRPTDAEWRRSLTPPKMGGSAITLNPQDGAPGIEGLEGQ